MLPSILDKLTIVELFEKRVWNIYRILVNYVADSQAGFSRQREPCEWLGSLPKVFQTL